MDTLVHVGFCFQFFLSSITAFNFDTEHVLILSGKTNGSYFGFSTEIVQDSFGSWLFVGAPKDNSSAYPYISQTGSVFKCEINFTRETTQICSTKINAVQREKMAENYTNIHQYRQSKQQLGSNVLIKRYSPQTLLACAPSYTLLFGRHAPGRCVIGDLSQRNPIMTFPVIKVDMSQFGMAQIGFSAASISIPSSSFDIVLGAPGTSNGKGGFLLFDTKTSKFISFSAKTDSTLRTMPGGSNLGYSTASGRFGVKTARSPKIVLGAPHFNNEEDGHVGLVVMIVVNLRNKRYKVLKSLTGNQVGAGFGSSLEVADVNGDGYDDLLVGSPTYTGENTDQGRVDVFYGTGNTSLVRSSFVVLLGLQKKGARFGHVIRSLGDVNNDNYNDIAVGAPYEDDEKGAVYLYHGKDGDMDSRFSQRIAASNLDPGLRGFGFHISHPIDTNGNTFNDMAVGSFLSDHAVLLRARPIASVDGFMEFDPPSMLLNSSGLDCNTGFLDTIPCLTVKLCFNYSGRALQQGLDIKFRLIADVNRENQKKQNRIVFDFHNGTLDSQKEDILHLDNDVRTCTTYNAKIKATNREFYQSYEEAIAFEMTYALHDSQYLGDVLPILDDKIDHLVTEEVDIDIGCVGGICRADLVVHTYPLDKEIILGRTKEISIKVVVENSGNPAFHTNVLVQSSPNAAYSDAYLSPGEGTEVIICPKVNIGTRNVSCFIERPLFHGQSSEFRVTFNVTGRLLQPDQSLEYIQNGVNVSVTASVDSPSTDVDSSNNMQQESFKIELASSVEITGYSSPDQAVLSIDSKGVIPVTYKYEVYNKGPSPLPSTEVLIDVPAILKDDVKFSPIDKCSLIKYQSIAVNLPSDGNHTQASQSPQTMNKEKESNRIFTNMSCYNISCFHLRCFTGQVEVENSFSVAITLKIKESELNILENSAGLRIQTSATMKSPQHSLFVPWESAKSTSVVLDVYPAKKVSASEPLPVWVIIVGCLGGFLLFIIILLILWKCGFFKRRKREEIQDWKRKSVRRSKYILLTSEEIATLPGPSSTTDQETSKVSPSSATDRETNGISSTSAVEKESSGIFSSSAIDKETSELDRSSTIDKDSISPSFALDQESNEIFPSSTIDKETSESSSTSAIDKETSELARSSTVDKDSISPSSALDQESNEIFPSSAIDKETSESSSTSAIDKETNGISPFPCNK